MTNGEKIKEIFPNAQIDYGSICVYVWFYISPTSFDIDWWNEEYKEPITKNNTVDFNKINELADFAIKATGQRDSYSQGMCNGIEYLRATLTDTKPKYIYSNDEYKEPTTKNNLGVDAVSRQSVLELIADYDFSMGQVVRGIHALPPVTQEPFKPMVEIDLDYVIKQKYIEREVLDKIRAEIEAEKLEDSPNFCVKAHNNAVDRVLGILDKYKAESEEQYMAGECTYRDTGCGSCKRQLDCPIK